MRYHFGFSIANVDIDTMLAGSQLEVLPNLNTTVKTHILHLYGIVVWTKEYSFKHRTQTIVYLRSGKCGVTTLISSVN
jgi:hypothetical protein